MCCTAFKNEALCKWWRARMLQRAAIDVLRREKLGVAFVGSDRCMLDEGQLPETSDTTTSPHLNIADPEKAACIQFSALAKPLPEITRQRPKQDLHPSPRLGLLLLQGTACSTRSPIVLVPLLSQEGFIWHSHCRNYCHQTALRDAVTTTQRNGALYRIEGFDLLSFECRVNKCWEI